MELTEAVKELRLRLKESQQAFATRLGISIRGLVNYEKDRDPPLILLLKLAAIARESGEDELSYVFQWAFYHTITEATYEHDVWFSQEDHRGGKGGGLMLLTFKPGDYYYVESFRSALDMLHDKDDPTRREKGKKVLDALYRSTHPRLKMPPE